MVLRICFCFLLAGAVSADETCCVDQDIAAAFMRDEQFSRAWPDSFPVDVDSPFLELIGSSVNRGGLQTTVGWKSTLSPDDARRLVTAALRKESWRVIPRSGRLQAMHEHGFVPHQPAPTEAHQQFCRGRAGQVTILARSTRIGTVVTLSHFAHPGASDCESTIAAQSEGMRYRSGLVRYLPSLQLPESIKLSPYMGGGSGGGSQDARASLTLETSVSPDNLMTYFDRQMVDQGWRMDANFRGNATIGHTWLRDVDGLTLACIVTAFSGANDRVRLRMHLEPL